MEDHPTAVPDDAAGLPGDAGVLVVDGANVVGARPDGWWRDRAGAAARLHDRLVAADLGTDVVLVLEGRARPGVPEGTQGRVRTVHATGSGDSPSNSSSTSFCNSAGSAA